MEEEEEPVPEIDTAELDTAGRVEMSLTRRPTVGAPACGRAPHTCTVAKTGVEEAEGGNRRTGEEEGCPALG